MLKNFFEMQNYPNTLHKGIELCREHRFTAGLFALLSLFAFIFSIIGYISDRNDADSSQGQVSIIDSGTRNHLNAKNNNNVDQILRKLELANIAFNAPSSLNISDKFNLNLALSLKKSTEQLQTLILDKGKKYSDTIKVSNRMQAILVSSAFHIIAITPEIQAVSKENLTSWKWEIIPKKEGQHYLHLTLVAFLDVDGEKTPRAIKTLDKRIEVTVTVFQMTKSFLSQSWQWLWAVAFVPFVGWFINKFKKC